MITDIRHYIKHTAQQEWGELKEEGIDTAGISVKVLRFDETTKRAPTILLKFDAGAKYPYHNHPAGEEVFVLEGDVIIADQTLTKGDYLFTPPNFKHSVKSERGCVLLFMIPEEVEII